jgi:opacity protein-like surface antigen
MKLNKLAPLTISLALLQLNSVYAQDTNSQPVVKIFNKPYYVSVLAGYARAPWSETAAGTYNGKLPDGSDYSIKISFPKNGDGGSLWGADIGYQFKPGLSFEIGTYQLPKVVVDLNLKTAGGPSFKSSGDISSRVVYLAGRIDYKLTKTMSLFSKFGIAEQKVTADKDLDSQDEGIHSNTCIGPFYSAGLSYQQNKNLALTLQFARIPGQAKHDDNEDAYSMNADLITAGAQFTFK